MTKAERRRAARALLASALRLRRREIRSLLAWSIVQAVPALVSGRLVAQALDDGFVAGRSGAGFAWLAVFGATMLVGAWGARQAYCRLAAIVEPFRDDLVERAVSGALRRSTEAGSPPDTASVARLTQHIEIVREAYASVLMVVQSFLVTTVSALLGLLSLMPEVLLLVVPSLVVGLAIFVAVLVRTASRQRVSLLADERIAEVTGTLAGAMRDIAACGGEDAVAAAVDECIDDQARATRDIARFTALQTLAIAVGGWLPVVLIVAAGPWLTRNGATTGVILGALTYVLQGVHPALQTLVRGLGGNGLWLLVTIERVVEAAALPVGEQPVASHLPQPRSKTGNRGVRASWEVLWRARARRRLSRLRTVPEPGCLALREVTFRYGPYADAVLDELTLDVPHGDHLAVVGPSGVGKSTLAGVMAGLLQPQSGDVSIGGVPLRELPGDALPSSRVLIPQQAYVFSGTLWENLTYLDPDASRALVDAAVDALAVRPLIERIGGFDAEVQPGALSAGERQLITLVRAFIAPAPIVILDEATCHLDPATEAVIERAFAQRPGTLIVIAHRISSALRAKRIFVMDGTRTVLGTHESLVRDVPLYADLVGHWWSASSPDPVGS
jgi:ATP-binding cassette subfamily C protein